MTTSDAFSKGFVGRDPEQKSIKKLLDTGDVLLLGEAGIGKTTLINKVVEELEKNNPKGVSFIRINVAGISCAGWLEQRIALKTFEEIRSNETASSKIKKWLMQYYPDLLRLIEVLLKIEGKVTGQQSITNTSSVLSSQSITSQPSQSNAMIQKGLTSLLEKYAIDTDKQIFIIIEDTHDLFASDRKYLTDLLANHSSQIHFILSRRTEEKGNFLYSSPEVNYLMRSKRLLNIKGLDRAAICLLFAQSGFTIDIKLINKILSLSRGNPYFINLIINSVGNVGKKEKDLETIFSQNLDDIWNYIHAHFFEKFQEYHSLLKVSSVLPSDINAELLGFLLNSHNYQDIQNQLLELERRKILLKDEIVGYHFFHPLFAMYLYTQFSASERKKLHTRVGLYYKRIAKSSPTPLNMVATQYHAQKSENKRLELWVLLRFTEIYHAVGNIAECALYSAKALQLATLLNDRKAEFRILIVQFGLSINTDIEELDKKILRLKHLTKKLRLSKLDKINALWAEANYFVGLGDPAKAINLIRKCRKVVKLLNDDRNYYVLVHYEASLLLDLRLQAGARKLLIKCLKEFKQSGDEKSIMAVLTDMGNLEVETNPVASIQSFKEC